MFELLQDSMLRKARKFRRDNPTAKRTAVRKHLEGMVDRKSLTPEQWDRILKIIEIILGILF